MDDIIICPDYEGQGGRYLFEPGQEGQEIIKGDNIWVKCQRCRGKGELTD